jgi:hypothetical protein
VSAKILHGVGHEISSIPDDGFREALRNTPARMATRLGFMTREHHLVRDFAVREIPRNARAIEPAHIAQSTGLKLDDVVSILTELEHRLFFLVRDAAGNVNWAFPVTAEATPHRLSFSTGEKIFGA